jgi:transcription elongation factor Elf1
MRHPTVSYESAPAGDDAHHDELIELMRAYAQGDESLACPRCGHAPLGIDNRSTPPYALWYQVECSACGMSELVHIPSGAAVNPGV